MQMARQIRLGPPPDFRAPIRKPLPPLPPPSGLLRGGLQPCLQRPAANGQNGAVETTKATAAASSGSGAAGHAAVAGELRGHTSIRCPKLLAAAGSRSVSRRSSLFNKLLLQRPQIEILEA